MTALAEKLKEAGADTTGARFTNVCIEAIRLNPDDNIAAWRHVGMVFGYQFILDLKDDMRPKQARDGASSLKPIKDAAPYRPRVIAPERLEKRREVKQIVRSKYMNSGGIAWSDVGWHELKATLRDGSEAAALLADGPAHVPNDGRTVGAVLGIKRVDEIIAEVRSRQ